MKLNREKAKKELTDNFCLLYGEEFRELFDKTGEELIELGIKNAREYFREYAVHETSKAGLAISIKWFVPGKFYDSLDDMKETITTQLKPFLKIDEINNLFVKQPYKTFHEHRFAPTKNMGRLAAKIENAIGGTLPSAVKSLRFKYFEQFPVYKDHTDCNLATESGLGLDEFHYSGIKYLIEEGDTDYTKEAVPVKYHGLGSVIGREEMRSEMITNIKKNINKETDYLVRMIVIIYLVDSSIFVIS